MRTLLLSVLMACRPGVVPAPGDDPDHDRPAACELGATIFDETVIHELAFALSVDDWAAMIDEADESWEYGGPDKTYFEADLSFDGEALGGPVGLRLKGHSSLLLAREYGHSYPLKLDLDRFTEDQTLDGLAKLNLHPNLEGITAVNEVLSYGAIRDHGVPTARVGFARVTLNGEELGLYALVEHMQGKFLDCHFPGDQGDLYKPEEPIGNLAWLGDEISDYEPEIQHKFPEVSPTEHASVLGLIDMVNHEGISAFEEVLVVDEVLDYFAVNVGLGNYDYYASFGHNYYLYESTPGRFTMLPWDMNFSQTDMDTPCGLGRNNEDWPISHKLLADAEVTADYLDRLDTFLVGSASEEALLAHLDVVLELIGDEVEEDALEELRDVIPERVEAQREAIAEGLDACPEWGEGDEGACEECLWESCGELIDRCFDDDDCGCVAECLFEDGEEDECLEDCDVAEVPDLVWEIVDCYYEECEEVCE